MGVRSIKVQRMLVDHGSKTFQAVMYGYILCFWYGPWHTGAAFGRGRPTVEVLTSATVGPAVGVLTSTTGGPAVR